ncbi:DUF6265 family protein [Sediminibacterium ginsengisoli]|uniref:DUF6265 domain-containing protein n=1 Tax=Sediminibacterium ginsengisoli TaxID=413434 RepID=A0A1T4M0L7_9BACT|nr:DUF6265 family protein [Sediminibacterium ginsengisoli]SJZ60550.1 hypothetical protein SAMN04488132_10394 [Sediminibacterium ginsengisoli]
MKPRILFTVIVLMILCSWTAADQNNMTKISWLTGTWENKTPKGSIYENWSRINDHELAGKSYAIRGKDTAVFENIRLTEESGKLFYIPTVKNQNAGLPVRFALKELSDTKMVFENLQHDFPQRISYTKISQNELVAEISGAMNGKERRQEFPMRRLK